MAVLSNYPSDFSKIFSDFGSDTSETVVVVAVVVVAASD